MSKFEARITRELSFKSYTTTHRTPCLHAAQTHLVRIVQVVRPVLSCGTRRPHPSFVTPGHIARMEHFPVILPVDHVFGGKRVISVHVRVRPGIPFVVLVFAQIVVLRCIHPHGIIPHVCIGIGGGYVRHQRVSPVRKFHGYGDDRAMTAAGGVNDNDQQP